MLTLVLTSGTVSRGVSPYWRECKLMPYSVCGHLCITSVHVWV